MDQNMYLNKLPYLFWNHSSSTSFYNGYHFLGRHGDLSLHQRSSQGRSIELFLVIWTSKYSEHSLDLNGSIRNQPWSSQCPWKIVDGWTSTKNYGCRQERSQARDGWRGFVAIKAIYNCFDFQINSSVRF